MKYEWKRRKLRSKQDAVYEAHNVAIAAAKAANKSYDDIESEQRFDWSEYDDDIAHLTTQYLIQRARVLAVAVPWDNADYWEDAQHLGKKVLTLDGQHALRASLRAEAKERSEGFRLWVPTAAAIVSALAALAANFSKK